MAREEDPLSELDLERQLLRRSVGTLTADREGCRDCGRIPLVGEQVHRYGATLVCALCRPQRADAPQSTELKFHAERGLTVRIQDRRRR